MLNLNKDKIKYEYYGSRAILLVFLLIEFISIITLFFGFYLDLLPIKILGIIGIVIGLYIIIGNFVGMYSLIRNSQKNKDILDKITNSLNIKGSEIILDAGCGRGRISNLMAKKLSSGRVFGIDIGDKIISSSDIISRAKQNAVYEGVSEKTEFIRGNILALPFKQNNFDIITCNSVLYYVKNENKTTHAVKEVKRVLNSNGKLLVLEMVRSVRGFFISTPFFYKNLGKKEEWKKIICKEGFEEIEQYYDRGRVVFVFNKI